MDNQATCPAGDDETAFAGRCPAHAVQHGVAPDDVLLLPLHRRTIVQHATDADGTAALHLYYGDKHISFDEPDLFAFGETLAAQPRFTARDAASWGPGYDWPRIQGLLGQLVAAGVLVHAETAAETGAAMLPRTEGPRPSPLPPAPCPAPRDWADCASITAELTGRAAEPGHLELVVPIFRIAHPALDAEGRQVGEANVFPPALRLDVPTEWRTSNLPGSRYQVDRPMNVTAMRSMRAHWPQMMAGLLRVRAGFLRRFPEAEGAWTVGHLERLATAVLAVPTYQLMRRPAGVASGALDPALSSMFRVTDGLRMTMHQMLFVPIGEPTLPPDAPMRVETILDYAERNESFHSEHGVCAGPKAMVREFLQVLIDGRADTAATELSPAMQAALADLDPAIDYALFGLQAHAALFCLWPLMASAYDRLAEAAAADASGMDSRIALQARLRDHQATMERATYLGQETWRAARDRVYADMFAQCGRGLGQGEAGPDLAALLAPSRTAPQATLACDLAGAVARRFGPAEPFVTAFSEAALDFLCRTQAILRTASAVQQHINRLLGRPAPRRAFTAADADIYNLLQGRAARRLPFLVTELEQLLGVEITIDPATITLAPPPAAAAA